MHAPSRACTTQLERPQRHAKGIRANEATQRGTGQKPPERTLEETSIKARWHGTQRSAGAGSVGTAGGPAGEEATSFPMHPPPHPAGVCPAAGASTHGAGWQDWGRIRQVNTGEGCGPQNRRGAGGGLALLEGWGLLHLCGGPRAGKEDTAVWRVRSCLAAAPSSAGSHFGEISCRP